MNPLSPQDVQGGEIIQGEKFQTLAGDNIFYCHTHDVNAFLQSRNFPEPFVLISHNSDGKIVSGNCGFPHASIDLAPATLVKWFAQNINVEDNRLVALPIGMENDYVPNAVVKRKRILEKVKEPKRIGNWVYMNFNMGTNFALRSHIWNLFAGNPLFTSETGVDFETYLNGIHNHAFVICPEGNGTDTHRTWEALYCQTIPIEKRNKNNAHFHDLPICFVDDWSDITESFLLREYHRIRAGFFNMDKLDFSFWKNAINAYRKI